MSRKSPPEVGTSGPLLGILKSEVSDDCDIDIYRPLAAFCCCESVKESCCTCTCMRVAQRMAQVGKKGSILYVQSLKMVETFLFGLSEL